MSYCNKGIKSNDILNLPNEISKYCLIGILKNCEQTCNRYYQCDMVALMDDRLKELTEKLLRCPHCDKLQEPCDCPDLFYKDINNSKEINEQCKLQSKLNNLNYNIVTCGHCGQVFIHEITPK